MPLLQRKRPVLIDPETQGILVRMPNSKEACLRRPAARPVHPNPVALFMALIFAATVGAAVAASDSKKKASEAAKAKPAKPAAEAKAKPAGKTSPAKEEEKPKSRTLKELVDLVLAQGAERSLGSPLSENLGFQPNVPTKAIRYKRSISPDGRSHEFHVIYEVREDGGMEAFALDWATTKLTSQDSKRFVDGWDIRLSTEGTPETAVRSVGEVGDVVQTRMPIDSPEVHKIYNKERQFYLVDSMGLEMSTK